MKQSIKTVQWLFPHLRKFFIPLAGITAIEAVISICSVAAAVASKNMIDAAIGKQGEAALFAAVVFAGLILLQVGLNAAGTVLSARTFEAVSGNFRRRLYDHLSRAKWQPLMQYHSGDILTRITSDTEAVTNGLVNTVPNMISSGVRFAAAFAALVWYEPVLAVLAFFLGPIAVLFNRIFSRRIKELHIKTQEAESSCRGLIHEAIQNILVIKAFELEEPCSKRLAEMQTGKMKLVCQRGKMNAMVGSIFTSSYWVGYIAAMCWGAVQISRGLATFGTMTAFLQLMGQVQGPFIGLVRLLPQSISAIASAGRLSELDKLPPEEGVFLECRPIRVSIKLDQVCFAYEWNKTVLKDISMEINPGEIAAVTGASGEGKTTLVRLLLSLVSPSEGSIRYTDDRNNRMEANVSCRSLISYVPQGNTLFSGTILENLQMGCPQASGMEMEEALNFACARDFVDSLPGGLNTVIGERGLGLSEGQAQRLAIARAFLRKSPILVLDEATSALDAFTEKKVLDGIRSLKPARTCILVTHRVSALAICDKVFHLENGRITECCKPISSSQGAEAV